VTLGAADDDMGHLLAGDMMSPSMTAPLADKIVNWLKTA
jgi:hypothetical protein